MMEGFDELLDRVYTDESAERDAQTQTDLLLPAGTYRTLPALTDTRRISDRNKVQAAEGERGRIEFRFFAQIQQEGSGDKGGVGFTISPDRKLNQNGKPDLASRLWTQAVNTYTAANGSRPASEGAVADFLRDYAVRVRINRLEGNEQFPEPSNLVVAISTIRE